jgi:hypothetical protein
MSELDQGQLAIVREIAFEVIKEYAKANRETLDLQLKDMTHVVIEAVREMIEEHSESSKIETARMIAADIRESVTTCPAREALDTWKKQGRTLLIGIVIGSVLVGGGGVLGIIKLFGLFK